MMHRLGKVLLVEMGAVVAFEQQRHATAFLQMIRPADRIIEAGEFLVEMLVLFVWMQRVVTGGTAIDPEHACLLCGRKGAGTNRPRPCRSRDGLTPATARMFRNEATS